MSGNPYAPGPEFAAPPMPPGPPPVAPDGARAVAVAVLNLSGLGLGYALLRRWLATAVCWAVTAVLLFVALPADADGVPVVALVLYLAFLALAAVHGAAGGLRRPLAWPGRAPVALVLGLALLLVPAGAVVLYDDAREEAVEQMLLDRLERADRLVAAAGKQDFADAEPDYRRALAVYRGLSDDHPGSRAAQRVPARMKTYYTTVAAPYADDQYCAAVEPLEFLRTVPDRMADEDLGALRTWPDDRLATSLYECASAKLAGGDGGWAAEFGKLLGAFPDSEQAGKVDSAVGSAVDGAARGVKGDDPCAAVEELRALGTQISGLAGGDAGAEGLAAHADRAEARAGTGAYACGVDQYRDGEFTAAQETMNAFVADHGDHRDSARARKIAIAAEIAQTVPEAGKRLPTTASGGSISVTVKNDSPDAIRVLYTGPVTGSLTLPACGNCKSYDLGSTLGPAFEPCSDSGKSYPQKTITLPPGTTYFLHKPQSGGVSTPASDTAKLEPGYVYTECAYETKALGSGI
ncbi:hypothetical protein [Streptomyces sp. NPDC006610]|uniref:hypothetical protein n=1 Tax=Streptomyces sp. NPDC006610 TaxID=3154584 RepID=UPI0033BCFB23